MRTETPKHTMGGSLKTSIKTVFPQCLALQGATQEECVLLMEVIEASTAESKRSKHDQEKLND